MPLLLVLLAFLTACAPVMWAYDLPEVIAVLEGPEGQPWYGWELHCVGDYNHDGCDDLLIRSFHDMNHENWLLLYAGGEDMSDEPVFQFTNIDSFHHFSTTPLQNIIPGRGPFIGTSLHTTLGLDMRMHIYELTEELEQEPEFSWVVEQLDRPFRLIGPYIAGDVPTDINGDGHTDMVTYVWREHNKYETVNYYWGGDQFDTEPDFSFNYYEPGPQSGPTFRTGGDVNGDGYDDIMICHMLQGRNGDRYSVLLGGDPPDSTIFFEFYGDHYQGRYETTDMTWDFCFLQDVNDDGYDEIGVCWRESHDMGGWLYEYNGAYIFFGGEEMSEEPDLVLEGSRHGDVNDYEIVSGDFNGDGIGDIVLCYAIGWFGRSELHIHFGGDNLSFSPDIYIDLRHEYNGQYRYIGNTCGAVGDYNGDSIDDFVVGPMGGRNRIAVIFAGSQDWVVSAPEEEAPIPRELDMSVSPNPFNSSINISISSNPSKDVTVCIYNITGQVLFRRTLEKLTDAHLVNWQHKTAGIYFISIKTKNESIVRKIVCLP